jgi:hypothetical protein
MKATIIAALAALAAAHPHYTSCPAPTTVTETVTTTVTSSPPATSTPTGPRINVIFFSDSACETTVPSTIFTRNVFGSVPCYDNFPNQTYSSLLIDEIDDQIIGTNTALQVGVTSSDQCDFAHSIKFNVATKDLVGKCQFIGIPQGQGKPLSPGNEYRLTNLQ